MLASAASDTANRQTLKNTTRTGWMRRTKPRGGGGPENTSRQIATPKLKLATSPSTEPVARVAHGLRQANGR
jgi:hypothetical protein